MHAVFKLSAAPKSLETCKKTIPGAETGTAVLESVKIHVFSIMKSNSNTIISMFEFLTKFISLMKLVLGCYTGSVGSIQGSVPAVMRGTAADDALFDINQNLQALLLALCIEILIFYVLTYT